MSIAMTIVGIRFQKGDLRPSTSAVEFRSRSSANNLNAETQTMAQPIKMLAQETGLRSHIGLSTARQKG
jgi:hypothetical protein